MSYYPPTYEGQAFTCPYCDAYAQMDWKYWAENPYFTIVEMATCKHCNKASFWFGSAIPEVAGKIMFPLVTSAPMPHPDMPDDVKADYLEARDVLPYSTRAAAALIRLALQRLCIHLGKNKKIDKAIGELVQDGLPQGVQRALDSIRIIGNESVHPGELQDDDIDKSVGSMFELLNFIVEDRIARLKKIDSIYESLPEGKLQGVEQRDRK